MPYFGNNPSPLLLNTVAQNGKEMTLDADADTSITADTDDQIDIKIGGADDFQFTANTFTAQSGSTIAAQALTATTITASGIIKTDDTTEATSTTDGSLQTDGGLSVVKDAVFGDDVKLLSDSAVLSFGADSEVTLTHAADTGLTLNTGWTVTGTSTLNNDVTFTGDNYNVMWDKSANDLSFDDNAKLTFGASNDLSVYHDGSNTYIDESGTGALFIRSSRVSMHKYTGETMINAAADGAVSLYYDDVKKLETTSSSVEIYQANLEINRSSESSTDTVLYFNGNGVDWTLGTDASDAGNLKFSNSSAVGTNSRMIFKAGGLIEHYANRDGNLNYFQNSHSSSPYGLSVFFDQAAPDNNSSYFLKCADSSATRCQIFSDGDVSTSDAGILSSDKKLKNTITDATDKWDDVKKLKVRNFYWNKDYHPNKADKKMIGFIAQEFETVFPGLVKEHKDTIDKEVEDENGFKSIEAVETGTTTKHIKEAKLIPILTKALQEAMARIETLEAKVKTLEEA
jgi:hypothetical protein